jgi:HK97 family phage portal protein
MAFELSLKIGNKDKVNKASQPVITSTSTNFPKTFTPISSFQYNGEMDLLISLFNNVPEINALVSYIAQIASGIEFEHVVVQANGKEKEVKKSQYIDLINNPNQNDNGYNMLMNAYTNFFVTGNVFFNSLKPVGFDYTTKLYLLPSNRTYPIVRGALDVYGTLPIGFDMRTSEITKYNLNLEGKIISIDPQQIIHIKDSSLAYMGKDQLIGSARIGSAIKNIQSLSSMGDTINKILSKGGALGFVKRNIKTGEEFSQMNPEEKKLIEDAFYSYGVTESQKHIMFTDADLSFQRILSNISDFMPIDISNHEFELLCKVIGGFPAILLKSSDSTFANMKEAQKLLYNNIIIPLVNSFAQAFTNSFGLPENEKIVPCFDDIEALQADKKAEAESMKVVDESLRLRYDNDEITLNEKLGAMGLPPEQNGNLKKSEIPVSQQILATRLGVGGTQSLQLVLSDLNMTSEQKYYTLIYVFGLEETQAKNLTNGNKETNTPTDNQVEVGQNAEIGQPTNNNEA